MALSYIEELTRILKSRKKEKSDIIKKDDKKDNDNKTTDQNCTFAIVENFCFFTISLDFKLILFV